MAAVVAPPFPPVSADDHEPYGRTQKNIQKTRLCFTSSRTMSPGDQTGRTGWRQNVATSRAIGGRAFRRTRTPLPVSPQMALA